MPRPRCAAVYSENEVTKSSSASWTDVPRFLMILTMLSSGVPVGWNVPDCTQSVPDIWAVVMIWSSSQISVIASTWCPASATT